MTSRDFLFGFDTPRTWGVRARHLHIRGWCVAVAGPIRGIRARIGNRTWEAKYGLERPDVCFRHRELASGWSSGFEIEVSVPTFPRKLVFEALLENETWVPFFATAVSRWRKILPKRKSGTVDYLEWTKRYDTLSDRDKEAIRCRTQRFQQRPLFSILLPTFNTPPELLKAAIESVREQLYPHWQLCIADDASTNKQVKEVLQLYQGDQRIKTVFRPNNGHISAASNSALALATGDFIGLLDHDDELPAHALYVVAEEINVHPEVDVIYSDEDKIDESGRRSAPYFKPDWNPDLLLAQNYVNHFLVYRASLLKSVGGFREGFEGAQDYDLLLRCTERTVPEKIRHIPHVLYHWRMIAGSTAANIDAKSYATNAARRAVQESLQRRNVQATVSAAPLCADYHRVQYQLPVPPPLVSLIIPTRNRADLLSKCVDSILQYTRYPNYEIVVVDNDSDEPSAISYFAQLTNVPKVRVEKLSGPFNYSAINNFGVTKSRGDVIGLLNNDVEVLDGDWLNEMVSHACRPEIGAVGCKLVYPDKRIQHAGVLLGVKGIAEHAFKFASEDYRGEFSRACLSWNLSAVTGACLFVRRQTYLEVGGLDEAYLPVAFNDLDFCLKLITAKYRNVYTPYATLVHHESASRGYEDTPEKRHRFAKESEFFRKKWKHFLRFDPAYNPNFDVARDVFSLAWPPRAFFPWLADH